jgi:hypothetical protein
MANTTQSNPPQPNEARYGIERLFPCPRLTRAIHLQTFGEEAPSYDPTRRIKRWVLPVPSDCKTPDRSMRLVDVWDPTLKEISQIAMTVAEAAQPNLPGAVSYPKYMPTETTAARMVGSNGAQGINGTALADPAAAAAIAGEINRDLGIQVSVQKVSDPWPWVIVWGSETRRNLTLVTASGQSWDAATLLGQRFAAGIGAPGRWVQGGAGVTFVPDTPQTGEMDLRPEIPMACRPLLPNERLEVSPFGVAVVRTDLTQDQPAPGTGSLTAAQDAILNKVGKDVTEILAKIT